VEDERELTFELREDETVVKTPEDKWHVVQYGEEFGTLEMFKTAYRRSLFRTPLLTNQRLVLLKDREMDHEIPLDNIAKVTAHRQLKIGTPYFRVELVDGKVINIIFECISERVLFGAGVESEIAWRMTKEWVAEINRQVNMAIKRTRRISSRSTRTKSPRLQSTVDAGYCGECGIHLLSAANYCQRCGAKVRPRPRHKFR
jgi:hypothetical protein